MGVVGTFDNRKHGGDVSSICSLWTQNFDPFWGHTAVKAARLAKVGTSLHWEVDLALKDYFGFAFWHFF